MCPKQLNINLLKDSVINAKVDKISELSKLLSDKNQLDRTFLSVYKEFRVGSLLSHLKIEKKQVNILNT